MQQASRTMKRRWLFVVPRVSSEQRTNLPERIEFSSPRPTSSLSFHGFLAFHALLLGNDAFYGKEASWTRGSLGILSMDGQVKDHLLEAPENDERF